MDNLEERIQNIVTIAKYEKIMESGKWISEIPYLNFKPEWQVKVIPPFAGAVIRFIIKNGEKTISVYLDCYNKLGCYNKPYWEIYPYLDDTFRCDMSDTESLLEAITKSFENF